MFAPEHEHFFLIVIHNLEHPTFQLVVARGKNKTKQNQHSLICDQRKHEMNAVFYLINSSNIRLPGRDNVIYFGCKDGKVIVLPSRQLGGKNSVLAGKKLSG